jgi:hypothetical protein
MPKRRHPQDLFVLGKEFHPVARLSYTDFNAGTGPQPVVCQRISDGPPAVPSRTATCARCLARVWVAPSTEAAMRQMRAPTVICLACCEAQIEAEGRAST